MQKMYLVSDAVEGKPYPEWAKTPMACCWIAAWSWCWWSWKKVASAFGYKRRLGSCRSHGWRPISATIQPQQISR
jgi:hypothetical protein